MTDKKKDYEAVISKELDEMLEQNPGLKKEPLYKLAGVLDNTTNYLQRIKEDKILLEPSVSHFEEMLTYMPLKEAVEKIEKYHKELKEVLFALSKRKPH